MVSSIPHLKIPTETKEISKLAQCRVTTSQNNGKSYAMYFCVGFDYKAIFCEKIFDTLPEHSWTSINVFLKSEKDLSTFTNLAIVNWFIKLVVKKKVISILNSTNTGE